MMLKQTPELASLASSVVDWQKQHGRHHLPWQETRDPYRIWLSEIMLQQTQVATVIDYYTRFLSRFPDIQSLAQARQEDVMPYWAGLGYYARARNLHRCAQELVANWDGRFPPSADHIATLPGIGRSTAAAIAAFAYGTRTPIMDGNVKRVFTRYFGIYGVTSQRAIEQELWVTAENVIDAAPATLNMAAYTQGLMDLGSQCCVRARPDCGRCPLRTTCYAQNHGVQHELPTPKPRKTSPHRECKMLVLRSQDKVLLEQQVSPGIWGGLWSLPRYGDASEIEAACVHMGQANNTPLKMAALLHVFSHFKLHIEPWYMQCETPLLAEPEPRQSWIAIEHLGSTALPAPIRKILAGLFDL